MRAGVVVFPGTNCDKDTMEACLDFGWDCKYIWHSQDNLENFDVIFLAGGFSYGDYIASGRLAKFSPVVGAIRDFVKNRKGFVVGICNGFQILCECGLLKGALTYNLSRKFICSEVELIMRDKSVIKLPIAHNEGRFVADKKTLEVLDNKNMIFMKYKDNPNGSDCDIAGIYDKNLRVLGMMPHPERAFFSETAFGVDGRKIFEFIQGELG